MLTIWIAGVDLLEGGGGGGGGSRVQPHPPPPSSAFVKLTSKLYFKIVYYISEILVVG